MKIIEEIKKDIKKSEEAIEEMVEEIIENVSGKTKKKKVVKSEKSEEDLKKQKKEELLEPEEKSKPGKSIAERKKDLLERVKKLSEKVDVTKTEDLKSKIKIKKRADMLIPLEDYVKSGIYIGTKVVTPAMRPFVYRRRADGLAIFNTDLIDDKLKEGIEYLSKFNPEDIILVCKRQAGWKAAEKFSELTGIRVFTKKYPAGILTNSILPDFFENELTIVVDSWLDRNAFLDTLRVHKKVLMICDTNNFSKGAHQVVIGNNKSVKSLGIIFYLLARGYIKAKKLKTIKDIPDLEWWTGEEG